MMASMAEKPTKSIDEMLAGFAESVEGLKGDALKAYESLDFYSQYVMGWNNPEYSGNSKFISRIYDELQYTNDDLLILGPRGSAKSTSVSITYTTWAMGRNPLIRILLCFASAEAQGFAFGRQIDAILSKNERYQEVFGLLKPSNPTKWTANEMIVSRREPPGGLKDPTIGIVGLNTNVPSKRADVIILDDIVSMDNAYSPVQRNKTERFVMQTLFPILVPGGRRIVVGSRWDPRDLYNVIAERWGLEIPREEMLDLNALTAMYL